MFLEDYVRFPASVPPQIQAEIEERVKTNPGITLVSLMATEDRIRANDVYVMIALDQIYVDLAAAPLKEHSWVQLYPDQQTHEAYVLYGQSKIPSTITNTSQLVANASLVWDGRLWRKREYGRNYHHTATGKGRTDAIALGVFSPVIRFWLYQHPENRIRSAGKARSTAADECRFSC